MFLPKKRRSMKIPPLNTRFHTDILSPSSGLAELGKISKYASTVMGMCAIIVARAALSKLKWKDKAPHLRKRPTRRLL